MFNYISSIKHLGFDRILFERRDDGIPVLAASRLQRWSIQLTAYTCLYLQLHSTETALVRVNNDIVVALDNHQSVILLLLDLSAAFDTVDHGILLDRLSHRFGRCGLVLSWFKSYLSNRFQFVEIRGEKSSHQPLTCRVPQGSVLGPILYLLYTSPLGDIVRRYNMGFHF